MYMMLLLPNDDASQIFFQVWSPAKYSEVNYHWATSLILESTFYKTLQ
jgi:hypothetical protein